MTDADQKQTAGSSSDSNEQNQGGDSGSEDQGPPPAAGQKPPPTLLEWGVRVFSMLILVGLTGYLLWTAFQPTVDPQFRFKIDPQQIAQRGTSWVVPLELTNEGSKAIEDLEVVLEVRSGPAVIEESAVTYKLLGAGESIKGEYWFAEDPRSYTLEPSVTGYRLP